MPLLSLSFNVFISAVFSAGLSSCLCTCFPYSFGLPDFFPCGHVVPVCGMVLVQGWSYKALCLVLRRSVWSCGALLGMSRCRCDSDLICPSENLSSQFVGRAPIV